MPVFSKDAPSLEEWRRDDVHSRESVSTPLRGGRLPLTATPKALHRVNGLQHREQQAPRGEGPCFPAREGCEMRRGLALIASGAMMLAVVMLPAAAGAASAQPTGLWSSNYTESAPDCGIFAPDSNGFCVASTGEPSLELGVKFTTAQPVYVTGVRIYRVNGNDPVHGSLWQFDGTLLATGTFSSQSGNGWQDLTFTNPVLLSTGQTYLASYHLPGTPYAFQYHGFTNEVSVGPITALSAAESSGNGVYCYDANTCFPNQYPDPPYDKETNYWVTPLWVPQYTLSGFYSPVDMNGVFNTVKGGSTVPLKFEVFWGGTEQTDVTVVDSLKYTQIACPSSSVATDQIEVTVTGGTSLRYDATAGQFVQNWKTPKKAGCYSVTMLTVDGSLISANFQLR
jgi:hypothetical protein